MMDIRMVAKAETTEVLASDIPIGTVFLGCMPNQTDQMVLFKNARGIQSLNNPEYSWINSADLTVTGYLPVRAVLTLVVAQTP